MDTQQAAFAVFVGVDIGKERHHAVALDRQGSTIADQVVANDEAALRALLTPLLAEGPVLLAVDLATTLGAMPVTVAQAMGVTVGYLPGLTMRRLADLHAGEAKTDRRDATIIADAARMHPQTMREVVPLEPHLPELTLLCGFDADLVQRHTALTNQVRGLLAQVHPALERVLGRRLDNAGVLPLLQRWSTPEQLQQAGRRRLITALNRHGSRRAEDLTTDLLKALSKQTVVVPGTAAAGIILAQQATELQLIAQQRAATARQIADLVAPDPLCPVLTSMPGLGVRTAAQVIVEIAGKEFASAAELASYAGLIPVTWRSGSSVHRDHAAKRGNPALKNALFQSAFTSLRRHKPSRAYYDRKRDEGKSHTHAVLALARRRTDVLYAMMRDGAAYRDPAPPPLTNT